MTPGLIFAALLLGAVVLWALPFALAFSGPDEEGEDRVSEATRRRYQ